MESSWSTRSERAVLQRIWGGEAVIYDPVAGNTYYLDSLSTAVLGCLTGKPASAESVARSLQAKFDTDSEADFLAAVQEALAKFHDMNLIQPANS